MEQRLTVEDGKLALRDHLLEKAAAARARYGPHIDQAAMMRMLDDREIVRYSTGLRFSADALQPGEFAHAAPLGEHPSQGFCLFVHPCFEAMPDALPLLIAYHIPPINYGDIASDEDCECFGAALLGWDPQAYYEALCSLADTVPPPVAPTETCS